MNWWIIPVGLAVFGAATAFALWCIRPTHNDGDA